MFKLKTWTIDYIWIVQMALKMTAFYPQPSLNNKYLPIINEEWFTSQISSFAHNLITLDRHIKNENNLNFNKSNVGFTFKLF